MLELNAMSINAIFINTVFINSVRPRSRRVDGGSALSQNIGRLVVDAVVQVFIIL